MQPNFNPIALITPSGIAVGVALVIPILVGHLYCVLHIATRKVQKESS